MSSNNHIRRRDVLRGAGGALVAALLPLPVEALQSNGNRRGKGGSERFPLRLPAMTDAGLPQLVCAPAMIDMGDGVQRGALAYNGMLPGPTWVAWRGENVTTTLVNNLAEPTITHWHGLHVDYLNDGGPRLSVSPGQTYPYSFPIIQRSSLNFYHPHPHHLTGKQVALGLSGAFIVRDEDELGVRLPMGGPLEVPLVIRDASFDSRGDMDYKATGSGFMGAFPLVNGTLNPYHEVGKHLYRLRILNGSNARVYNLRMGNNQSFWIIGNDGGLFEAPVLLTSVVIGPGERLDVLLDFSPYAFGTSVSLVDANSGWNLVEFRVRKLPAPDDPVQFGELPSIERLSNPVTTRVFSFDGMSKINNQRYDMNRIDFQVPFGQVERWVFVTNGNGPHPVHVHGASFQVQSRSGGRNQVFPWEQGWKDTVLVQDQETVEVFIKFNAYRGLYVLHCHQLEHEDMGMMSNFEVV